MDCIHYKVREDGRILSCVAYIVLGATLDGYKDILSITVGANETSKFWFGMLNDLKNRGLLDVLFFCMVLKRQLMLCILRQKSSAVSSICCVIPLNKSITMI